MHPFFALGRIRIPAWGTLAALGAAAGLWLCLRLLPKGRRRDGGIVLLWALAGAAVGAKVSYLFAAPGDVPLRLASGFVYYGGLWGGALAAAAAASHRGCPALEITDAASPGLALGHALGRIGCFLAGCCWGIPAPEPWGIALPQALAAPRGVPLLPVPLYEAAGNALLCAGLLFYRKKKPRRTPGSSTGLYLSAYAVLRFLLEFLRGDEARGRWGSGTRWRRCWSGCGCSCASWRSSSGWTARRSLRKRGCSAGWRRCGRARGCTEARTAGCGRKRACSESP